MMAKRGAGGGGPGNAGPDLSAILRDAEEAMRKAEASLARIGEGLAKAEGVPDRAIQEAFEAQRRAIREASRAQEQAVAAAEAAIGRAMAAASGPRKKR